MSNIPPKPEQFDAAFKDAVFNLVKKAIDEMMPDIVDGSVNLYEVKLRRVINEIQKEFDKGFKSGLDEIHDQVNELKQQLGETADEKIRSVLANLDDLADAFGAPEKLVSALHGLEDITEPVIFIKKVLEDHDKSDKRPTKKESYGIAIAIISILGTLMYFIGAIFGIDLPLG